MISLENIYFRYQNSDFKLDIDHLTFEKGSKTAIIGTSGFGKTTMLNLIAGILLPEKGKITIENNEINVLPDSTRRNFRIQHIGFIFQDFKLIPYLNVLDNILLPYHINNIIKISKETLSDIHEIVEEVGIADKLKKKPSELSQGEKQRVAICRALVQKPSIILADEPTGNLDPVNKSNIMKVLFAAVEKNNSTLITVTHDHEMLSGFENVVDFKNFQSVKQ